MFCGDEHHAAAISDDQVSGVYPDTTHLNGLIAGLLNDACPVVGDQPTPPPDYSSNGLGQWVVSWTPVEADMDGETNFKRYIFQIIVNDTQAVVTSSWSVDLFPDNPGNIPPRFLTLPVTSATVGQEYRYDIVVDDPDLDDHH